MEDYEIRWGTEIAENMGRAVGIGVCYVPLTLGTEYYIYINIWKYNIAIGRLTKPLKESDVVDG